MTDALELKLKKYFGDMLVYKSSGNAKFFSARRLPSFMRDWLVMKFSDEDGRVDTQEISDYVKEVIPKEEQWNKYMISMLRYGESVRFLAKPKKPMLLLSPEQVTRLFAMKNTDLYNALRLDYLFNNEIRFLTDCDRWLTFDKDNGIWLKGVNRIRISTDDLDNHSNLLNCKNGI